jgi:hypothetical protein
MVSRHGGVPRILGSRQTAMLMTQLVEGEMPVLPVDFGLSGTG